MAADDWLDIGEPASVANLPVLVMLPESYADRLVLAENCWNRLAPEPRQFLVTLREKRFNIRATARELYGSDNSKKKHYAWLGDTNYATVLRIWRATYAQDALDKDRLLARQDEIVETLLTPKPILYQGEHTGFEEVDASAASRANEVLLDRAMPKPRADVEVNVGVAFVPPSVEVVKTAGRENDAENAEFVEVSPALPRGRTVG